MDHEADAPWRSELLLSLLDSPLTEEVARVEGLELRLAAMLDAGRDAWPAIELPPEQYLAHLARHLHDANQLAAVHASDLYLAAACTRGDRGAIEACIAAWFPALDASLRKLGAAAATIDETRQIVLEYLFVGTHPAIASYAGRGELRGWLRSIGVRTCRRLMGTEPRAVGDELDDVPAAADPELDYLKVHYRDQFRTAFRDALATLTPRQRNVLRQHYVDGLSIDKLGALYRIHRATAARWVASARRALLDATRDRMVHQLGVDGPELDSIIRLIRSQLELSIHETLG